MTEVSKILDELNTLIGEDLKVVSFKWLARHFSIPADLAKQVLFAFVEKHRSKVNATYLLGGWTKGDGGRQHVFQLVDGARLPEFRKRLDPLTSLHVYSVQPTQPKDPAELWNTDCQQTTELFDSMVRSLDQNCLVDNRWSAVECQAAKRDPGAARKVPVQPEAEVLAAAKPPPPSRIAAKVDGIMAGATAERDGVVSTSVAVRGSGSSSLQKPPTLSTGPASVAARASSIKPGAKADSPAQKGKGGAALSAMWKKAPAKKAQKKVEAAAVDGDAAIRLAQEESADSDSDDDDAPVAKRKASRSAAVFDDDEEEEEEGEEEAPPKKPKPAAAPKAKGKKGSQAAAPAKKKPRASQLDDSDEEQQQDEAEEEAAALAPKKGKGAKDSSTQKKAPAKRASKKQEPPAEEDKDAEMALDGDADEEAADEAPTSSKSRKPSFGGVKAGAETGVKRRKVTKTVINDKGEEVTETTWEEEPAGSQASDVSVPPRAAKSAPAAPCAAAPKAAEAKPAAKDSGAAKPGKKSVPSKKSAPSGQRGIMSFFQKK